PCFRPVRPQQITHCFPLTRCAVRIDYLKELVAEAGKLEGTRVHVPYCSPFFFIHSEMSLADWRRIHTNKMCRGRYKTMARWLSFPALGLFLIGIVLFLLEHIEVGLLFMTPLIVIELLLLGWYTFSLGIRRGLPFYLYFSAQRVLRLFNASV
ncbi:MAG: hypothetical protein ACRCY4_04100, partial [Brevinema sp.]